jgi:hypothetical protein
VLPFSFHGGVARVDDGNLVYCWWIFSFSLFFYRNYSLTLFVVDISTLIFAF